MKVGTLLLLFFTDFSGPIMLYNGQEVGELATEWKAFN